MALKGAVYKVTSGPNAPGAWWWAGSGPYIYIPVGSGVGQQYQAEMNEGSVFLTAAAFDARAALHGTQGGP